MRRSTDGREESVSAVIARSGIAIAQVDRQDGWFFTIVQVRTCVIAAAGPAAPQTDRGDDHEEGDEEELGDEEAVHEDLRSRGVAGSRNMAPGRVKGRVRSA